MQHVEIMMTLSWRHRFLYRSSQSSLEDPKISWIKFFGNFLCSEVKVNFRNLTEQDVLCSIF